MGPPDLEPWGLDSRSQDHFVLERNLNIIARIAMYNWLHAPQLS
jgi:hypothetical protein